MWTMFLLVTENGLTLKHRNPMSKFITRLPRHSQEGCREADGAVRYDQVTDDCKKKQSDNAEYWSDKMKKDFVNAPHYAVTSTR